MFQLIATDPRFYVIAKAPGVGFHREGDAPGLLDILRAGLQDEALWPVHRLDKVTSGLIVVARSQQAASALGAAFAGREVQKYYLALSDAKPNRKQGLIKGDMEKGRGGAWKLCRARIIRRSPSSSATRWRRGGGCSCCARVAARPTSCGWR